MEIKITAACPDLSSINENSISDIVDRFSSSDIILFPEYLLELAPEPKKSFPEQLIVFGSEQDLGYNKIRISMKGDFLTYNKQRLTPLEKHLKPGSENICIHYKDTKIGIAAGFDIEHPELVADWRQDDLDVLLVPSATESAFGYERVNRCASARSVELGCGVITCHLIGESRVGNHHLYLPSQSLFEADKRIDNLIVRTAGEVIQTFSVNIDKIRQQREFSEETNPSI